MTEASRPRKRAEPVRPGPKGHSEEMRMTARALYEGNPNVTTTQIADQAGCSVRTLQAWSKEGGWERCQIPLTNRAHMIADQFRVELEAIGPDATPEQKEAIAAGIVEQDVTGQRAEVLGRHRKEWNAMRALLYRGIQEARTAKGFEAAKFAKISAENLTIIQNGERKAWGMDKPGEGDDNIVVIERRESGK